MMGAEEQNIKERIWFSRMEYSVLNEKMKRRENEWGEGRWGLKNLQGGPHELVVGMKERFIG
jgi:hypothetical protein